jgi:hypothetical protein
MKSLPRTAKALPLMLALGAIWLGGQLPTPLQRSSLQRDLTDLVEQGFSYRVLGDVVEIEEPLLKERRKYLLSDLTTVKRPTYENLPTLTIDLTAIDTNLYNWKYHYHSAIPVSGGLGYPLLSGDANRDSRLEVYGIFQSQQVIAENRIYEEGPVTPWALAYIYPTPIGASEIASDVDRNGLSEIIWANGLYKYVYEQGIATSYPTELKFSFRPFFDTSIGILDILADLDGDNMGELIYRGSEQDSVDPERNIQKIYIAKYDHDTNNFVRIWGMQLPPGCLHVDCTGTMTVGDFDGDGFQDVVTSAKAGNIYDIEYFRRDSIRNIWTDSISAAGYTTSGDVDGNGAKEFFVGGKQVESDGYLHLRIYAYEKTGNNSYRPVSMINIFPVGFFFVDSYHVADMDRDNQPELLLSFGGGVVIISGDGVHRYRLDYYKSVQYLQSVSSIQLRRDRVRDLMISRLIPNQQVFTQTEVYRLDSTLTDADEPNQQNPPPEILSQNFPNPLNPETTITFALSAGADVRLTIFDIQGKEVRQLANSYIEKGQHSVRWDGRDNNDIKVPSGVYLCRMVNEESSRTIKMLLVR